MDHCENCGDAADVRVVTTIEPLTEDGRVLCEEGGDSGLLLMCVECSKRIGTQLLELRRNANARHRGGRTQ